jgi:hypothetical protein
MGHDELRLASGWSFAASFLDDWVGPHATSKALDDWVGLRGCTIWAWPAGGRKTTGTRAVRTGRGHGGQWQQSRASLNAPLVVS